METTTCYLHLWIHHHQEPININIDGLLSPLRVAHLVLNNFDLSKQVKKRYDSTAKLWRELPTGAELAARPSEPESNPEVQPSRNTVFVRIVILLFVLLIF